MTQQNSLPPEESEISIDVSLRHVIVAFGGLLLTAFTVGAGIVMVRDYTKYRRHKAIIDAAGDLIKSFQNPQPERGEDGEKERS